MYGGMPPKIEEKRHGREDELPADEEQDPTFAKMEEEFKERTTPIRENDAR